MLNLKKASKIFFRQGFKAIALAICFLYVAFPASAGFFIPNDPYFKDQWGLYNYGQIVGEQNGSKLKAWTEGVDINVIGAWDILYNRGKNAINTLSDKDPIVIAVIDTGVDYNQEDLKDRILRNSSGGIVGYDYIDNDFDPMDTHGHGTMVASIAAAAGNNGKGMAGVAWDAKIMPIRILDQDGHGDEDKFFKAILFAADNGADIINMSLVSHSFSQSITNAVEYAYNKGIVLVAAAGNGGYNLTNNPLSPINNEGGLNMVIGVGAVNSADSKFPQSNFGKGVDISAPGTNLIVAETKGSKNYYSMVSGTSAAAAMVSGAAALIKNYHRDWNNKRIMDAIFQNASPFKSALEGMGPGRLNAAKSLSIQFYKNNRVLKLPGRHTIYATIASQGKEAEAVAAITSPEIFLRLGYNWNEVSEISEIELGLYEQKLPLAINCIYSIGNVIKSPGDNTIYLVEPNQIRGFSTWNSFISRGFNLGNVKIVPQTIIEAYKKGVPL